MSRTIRLTKADVLYLAFLALLIAVYSFYFLPFTVFEGLSTFSNDSGGYVLMARKWSPYFPPSAAELGTWPFHDYPPGLSWALALTGMSERLLTSHLFVAVCMLLSIGLIGWYSYRMLGWVAGVAMTLGLCWLPGVMFSSMGILSENLYLLLSLLVLLALARVRETQPASWRLFAGLAALLALATLTRSIGIALIGAVAICALLDTRLDGQSRFRLMLAAMCGSVLWLSWGFLNPRPENLDYLDVISLFLEDSGSGLEGLTEHLLSVVSLNLAELVVSWNQYVVFRQSGPFVAFSLLLLFLSLYGLVRRLLQREPDSIYLAMYLMIIAVWPYPEEMARFIHPIVFLLILQPLIYFTQSAKQEQESWVKMGITGIGLVLLINAFGIASGQRDSRNEARTGMPDISNSYDYFASTERVRGRQIAIAYVDVMNAMKSSAEMLPPGSIVASVKHEFYAVLTGMQTVNLVSTVSFPQQLCNLRLGNVDAIFFSNLTTNLNPNGTGLVGVFRPYSVDVITLGKEAGRDSAYLLVVDRDKLEAGLDRMDFLCQSFQELAVNS